MWANLLSSYGGDRGLSMFRSRAGGFRGHLRARLPYIKTHALQFVMDVDLLARHPREGGDPVLDFATAEQGKNWIPAFARMTNLEGRHTYSTVTDFARFRGWSTSVPRCTATW